MIHTLKYAKKSEDAGVAREQAEAHVSVLAEFLEEQMATKGDILRIDARIHELTARMDARFEQVDARFQRVEDRFAQLELKLTMKMGSMLAASVAVLAALIQLK